MQIVKTAIDTCDSQNKVRSSNLELLRIVAMLGIILSHYQFFLGDMMTADPTSTMSIYHYALGMGGKIGINAFMLLTGYFMCIQDTSLKKYIKLLVQIYFYNIIIRGTFMIIGNTPANVKSVMDIIFPFRRIHMDYFVTDFLWFYLFIPFVAILVKSLTREQHFRLMILSLIMFIGYNTIPGFSTTLSPVTWFAVIMLVASYIRIHKPSILQYTTLVWGTSSILLIICAIGSIVILVKYGQDPRRLFADGNSFFTFLIAFTLFMTFLKLKLRYNKWINLYGGAAFGVLLIHSNCWPIRELIFLQIVDTQKFFLEGNMWMPVVICISIYIVCGTIEIIRQNFIEQPILSIFYKLFRLQ